MIFNFTSREVFAVFRRRLLPLGGSLLFHRLAEAIAFAVHLKDFAVVRQPVQQSGRHPLSLKHLLPFAERQVAGDQQAGPFVAIGEHLKQQFRSAAIEGQIAQFIADQEIELVELPQEPVELILLLRFFQPIHQGGRREEPYALAQAARRHP